MTTEHLSVLSAARSFLTRSSCLNVSIAPAFILLYPSLQAGQARHGESTDPLQMLSRSPVLVASAPVPWLPCSLSNYQAALSLFTSHFLFSVMVHLPSLLGHERGLHPAVKHLIHLAQCISKQCRKECISPYCLFHTV